MNKQPTLFDISECTAEPWKIPADLKRIEFIPWVKQNARELARGWFIEVCNESPEIADEDGDLQWDFEQGKTKFVGDDYNLIEKWLLKKYGDALKNG